MLRGHVDEISTNRVAGWAFDDADLRVPLTVDIEVDGRVVASPVADGMRADLEKMFGDGRHGFSLEFQRPLAVVQDHIIRVYFGGTQQLIENGERALTAISIKPEPVMRPILVSTSGRTGSTVLLSRLSSHPAITIGNFYPFEIEHLKYFGHAFSVLTSLGDHDKSGSPDNFIDNARFVGASPYFTPPFAEAFKDRSQHRMFYGEFVPKELAHAFRNIIAEFYRRTADDADKAGAVYFAERAHLAGATRWFARNLFGPVREIVLVRDLRDTLCSFRSFWPNQTVMESMRLLAISYRTIMEVHHEARADVMLVRYEDLILEEAATLRRIVGFLGLPDLPPEDAEASRALFAKHGTAGSPAASIGRWKRDLPIEAIREATDTFGPFLEAFGYET